MVHLIESMAKRCRFLEEVVATLALPAMVHHARAEELLVDEPSGAARYKVLRGLGRLVADSKVKVDQGRILAQMRKNLIEYLRLMALWAPLEREQAKAGEVREQQRLAHEEDLQREREAKERAIAAAGERLSEIEAQAEAAERRVGEAERRAAEAEQTVADEMARAREGAAGWLREQLETIRREAEGR